MPKGQLRLISKTWLDSFIKYTEVRPLSQTLICVCKFTLNRRRNLKTDQVQSWTSNWL